MKKKYFTEAQRKEARKRWRKGFYAKNPGYEARQRVKHRYDYLKNYGLTIFGYSEMLVRQGLRCAICDQYPKWDLLVCDHDHKTGKVRGLLCKRCNAGLGMYDDIPERFYRAAKYLKEHNAL